MHRLRGEAGKTPGYGKSESHRRYPILRCPVSAMRLAVFKRAAGAADRGQSADSSAVPAVNLSSVPAPVLPVMVHVARVAPDVVAFEPGMDAARGRVCRNGGACQLGAEHQSRSLSIAVTCAIRLVPGPAGRCRLPRQVTAGTRERLTGKQRLRFQAPIAGRNPLNGDERVFARCRVKLLTCRGLNET